MYDNFTIALILVFCTIRPLRLYRTRSRFQFGRATMARGQNNAHQNKIQVLRSVEIKS